jgi:NAD(P)-dependent dehydrogenase (short-subunit alcohol dehydrogenase family)
MAGDLSSRTRNPSLIDCRCRGIRENTLSPGAIDTPIIDGQFKTREEADGARALFSNITPLGRIGRPEEMASASLFPASDDSSYSTGSCNAIVILRLECLCWKFI